jgi:predicted transcriptional regulator
MASFTDLIPKFNPYIQQLPVEAMVSVGMDKQRRYEEGVQRIQSQIDQVAGLSVLRPIDKEYLQSKLNALGSNLKGVAAGDFSNFQLVNSVGGMVSQISKDPYIRAAVSSAQVDRENKEFMEKEKASGKLTPQNELHYLNQKKKYFQSGLKDDDGNPIQFSGRYVPYTDVRGKLREIAKDIGVDENTVQNLFTPDGKVNKVMIETLTKGKDVNKVYNAFVNGLTPQDYQQLAIDGVYEYRNYGPEKMIESFRTSNDQFVATANDKMADIKGDIADLLSKKATVKTPEELADLNKQISFLEGTLSKISQNVLSSNEAFESLSRGINLNDEDYLNGIKAKTHSNNFLKNVSKEFANQTSHVKYSENPLWKAMMDEDKFALDKWYKMKQVDIDMAKLRAAETANKLKAKEIENNALAAFPITIPAPGGVPGVEVDMAEKVMTDHLGNIDKRKEYLRSLAQQDMKRVLGDGMEKWLSEQAKNRKQSREEVMETWGANVLTKIKTGALKPESSNQNLISTLDTLDKVITATDAQIKDADNAAFIRSGSKGTNEGNILKSLKETSVVIPGFTDPVTLSPADQIDLAKMVMNSREVFSKKGDDRNRKEAISRLTNKFGETKTKMLLAYGENQYAQLAGVKSFANKSGVLDEWQTGYNIGGSFLYNLLTPGYLGGGNAISAPGQLIDRYRNPTAVQNIFMQYASDEYKNFKKTQEDVYREKFKAYMPINEAVLLTSKTRDDVKAKLTASFGQREELESIVSKMNEDGSQLLFTSTPPIAGIALGGATQVTMTVVGKDGKPSDPMVITSDQYSYLTGKTPFETDPRAALVSSLINSSPDGSSNKAGIGSTSTAYFSSSSFSNLKDHKIVGGDFKRDAMGSEVYYPSVYYIPRGETAPVTIDFGVGLSLVDVMKFPNYLTDARFRQKLNSQ